VTDAGYMADVGPRLYGEFMARGLLVRPLGNTIYLMPPYCSTAGEIEAAYQGIEAVADVITARK
jgi:adenosylmethionine-8-amino-7-oxononanoate aminotransferase